MVKKWPSRNPQYISGPVFDTSIMIWNAVQASGVGVVNSRAALLLKIQPALTPSV